MGSEWYVARDGETFGPFTFERMCQGAREGELRLDDPVWCSGMPDWQLAGGIPEIWSLPTPTTAPVPIPTHEDRESQNLHASPEVDPLGNIANWSDTHPASQARPKAGFVLRHWRGELTLAQAYWGVCFLLSLVVIWASGPFGTWLGEMSLPPVALGLVLICFLTFLCAMTIWQLMGTWRAAGNHVKATGRRGWATLARLAVVVGAIRAASEFANVIWPMLEESTKLATGRDDTPAYQLRLLRDGTEIELAGGMPFGTADAMRKVIDAAPGVKVIHLNSIGGRIDEGLQIYRIVRERNLTTYTATECLSACTIAFLGGSQRYLAPRGRLGFHSGSFGSVDGKQYPNINADMRRAYSEHDVPRWFVDKALSTSAHSMWYPVHTDLISANIVTLVVDPSKFAISGVPNWQAFQRELLAVPFYALIKENDPEGFKKIADRASEAVNLGKTQLEISQAIQDVFGSEVLPKYLKVAPDGAIQRYWQSQLAEMNHLSKGDPALCVAFSFPELRRDDFDLHKLLPPALLAEDIAALTEVIKQAIRAPNRQPVGNPDEELLGVLTRLYAIMPAAREVLAEPSKYFNDPRTLCDVTLAYYTNILNLPPARSGPILRSFAEPQT